MCLPCSPFRPFTTGSEGRTGPRLAYACSADICLHEGVRIHAKMRSECECWRLQSESCLFCENYFRSFGTICGRKPRVAATQCTPSCKATFSLQNGGSLDAMPLDFVAKYCVRESTISTKFTRPPIHYNA